MKQRKLGTMTVSELGRMHEHQRELRIAAPKEQGLKTIRTGGRNGVTFFDTPKSMGRSPTKSLSAKHSARPRPGEDCHEVRLCD
jgi:hypothetical protein